MRSAQEDMAEFADMQRAFGELNMGAQEVECLFRAAAVVLLLGNVCFVPKGDTGSAVDAQSRGALTDAAAVLQVENLRAEPRERRVVVVGHDGEIVSVTVRREFSEEVGAIESEEERRPSRSARSTTRRSK